MTPKPRVVRAVVGLAFATAFVAGCGLDKVTEQFNDAPRGELNTEPADIISFPDGFSNASAKCDGPNRVYVIFHADSPYGSIAVAPNDPRCTRNLPTPTTGVR